MWLVLYMIQLKIKTEYSFGKTFAPIDRVIKRLKEIGCTAAGIVDESSWGHVAWFEACKKEGIQPLLGAEICVSDSEERKNMWFLATNTETLGELYAVLSKGHRQKLSTKRGSFPRLYTKDVLRMSEGIFKFAGEVLDGEFLRDCGAIIDFNPSSRILNAKKKQLSEKYDLRTVSTSDNSFAFEEDSSIFELVSKAGLKPSPQYILEALDHQELAQEIATACSGLELPKAPMVRSEGNLEQLCREGIKFRKMESSWTEEYETRLNYELGLIHEKDFESYFLIVADMICYAKEHMLVGTARGSSAGSLVCYLTRITEIDPIPPGLIFERFIDISRSDLPDIDSDFPDDKRYMVFEYMAEKYGIENVCHIGTISQYKPKSALIQVCKSLGIPPLATASVKVAMIERSSADSRANNCLQDTLETTDPGKAFIKQYPQAAVASMIEGHASHTGVHAAGLLISNEPITNYAVVDAEGIAHIEKGPAEALGLLKIDVLGLRTLGVLEDSGINIDWYNLPLDDQKTFDLFNSGRFCGIFQFDGNALRAVSSKIKFETINEIDAVTALARPGPFGGGVTEEYCARKSGKKYTAMHPALHEHLKETFGLPVYQEQTMNIVRHVGQFSWKDTSIIRKAMSKRLGKEFFDTHFDKFKIGAASMGVEEKEAKAAWDLINSFGAWAFNKSHSYSYALVSYWTAYLKAHHPLEFAATNLRNAKDEDSAVELLREMVREGIEYVPFDINHSVKNWSAIDGKLYGGFLSLKGIGEKKAEKLIAARDAGKLTDKQRSEIENCFNIFADIFPLQTKYANLYSNPTASGILGNVNHISDISEGIPHGEERVFIAELIYKNQRDANEEVKIKKRGGKIETGPVIFVDVRLRDDTGQIGGRINRFDYDRIGKELLESTPIGSHLLIRAKFWNGIRYAFITKWKRLDV